MNFHMHCLVFPGIPTFKAGYFADRKTIVGKSPSPNILLATSYDLEVQSQSPLTVDSTNDAEREREREAAGEEGSHK